MTGYGQNRFRIDVLGPLRLTSPEGHDHTPKGAKNQALVALLALSPGMERPRRWIEDKLWSNFGPEQASANLRQSLSKLRNALGPHAEIVKADRASVGLDETALRVDLLEEVVPTDSRTELLEGLDVRDPEFEDWLRQERAQLQTTVSRTQPGDSRGVLIGCTVDATATGRDQFTCDVLSNQIGETIAEQVRSWRQADPYEIGAQDAPLADVLIQSQLVSDGDGHMLFIKAMHQPSARLLYSKFQRIEQVETVLYNDDSIARTVFEAADQIVGKLPHVLAKDRPETRSTALSRLSLYRMFSFEQDALREAYGLMDQAFKHDENGLYLAWSSLIRITQMMEMAEEDQAALQEEAISLYYRAMELSSDNGLVQAIVSKVRSTVFGDNAGVMDLARTAVDRNPSSAFAVKALSEATLGMGETDKAFELSQRACTIARSSPFKHWWDSGHCFISIAADRFDDAIDAGEAAARAAPLSRPAHRSLLALYAHKGDLEKAQSIARKLTKIEPGFSVDRMVNDADYPVRTLRNKGLLEPLRALV